MAIKHTFKTKDGLKTVEKYTQRMAIKEKCKDCTNWQQKEIDLCTTLDCALYPFRNGKTGIVKKPISDEQRKIISDRFAKARSKKNSIVANE